MPSTSPFPPVTLLGFPLHATGRGEHIRAVRRALAAAGVPARIHNLEPGKAAEDPTLQQRLGEHLSETVPAGIRLFHVNADNVSIFVAALRKRRTGYFRFRNTFTAGYNIVFPAWELPRYPAPWARELEQFDEVWAASDFAYDAIRPAVRRPMFHIPNACEPHITTPLDRSHFGIPAHRFAILFFFDFRSYSARKNPSAVIEAFRQLREARPDANVQLVLKFHRAAHDPSAAAEVAAAAAAFGDRVSIIDVTLSNNESWNLVGCCDCFLSLHRSEGFGRGPAEAMFFGKPVIATGWSGNMEYMRPDNSFPVRYSLIPVGTGEYPFSQGQVWAEPDVKHATELLIRVVDNPSGAKRVGERAQAHMRANYSDVVLGARYRARFERIASDNRF